ncbi:MAG: hypothetical protein KA603_10330 [Azonexus sp.]|nr:hypothetical protein [Betaproteobacteria bacterium]MBK8916662.1 hypothetical protein [Betaproteobacteria bacterium]MBP6036517.1 hypothetical protein [Azonexus sp.]MBP6907126.1 hypothetical protein [Azonexus sp.]
MIDILGFAYTVAKDINEYLKWTEEEKLVDFSWPEKSGLKASYEANGYSIAFVRPDRIASLQLDGTEIVYEIDKRKRIKRRVVLRDGLVLVGTRIK